MNVIGYLRVSTESQAVSGHGMDAQRHAISKYAEYQGHDVLWVEDPGYSGKNTKRPGLNYARSLIKQGKAEALVVSRLDRLARSVADFVDLIRESQKDGWTLIILNPEIDLSTSSGRMIANVLMSIAEFEAAIISERIKVALAAAKKNHGIKPGPKPTPVPADLAHVVETLHARGHSTSYIARHLTRKGYPLLSGKESVWQPVQVQRLLTRITDEPEETAGQAATSEWRATMYITQRVREGATIDTITSELNERGYRTRTGQPWTLGSVHHYARSS
jgi:DNA invertase Pin-like site-specific DNA recombinase